MFIDKEIILSFGGVVKKYKKGDLIFNETELPRFYFQIIEGKVKMVNTNFEGKEFTQAEFQKGNSFGEPPLFINESYPASAIACTDISIIKLEKTNFFKLLEAYPEVYIKLVSLFAKRIYSKAVTAKEIINNSPEQRIVAFLNAYKKRMGFENEKITIGHTRQEIANFTGLRVETVIRTLTKMKKKKIVDIINRKLIY